MKKQLLVVASLLAFGSLSTFAQNNFKPSGKVAMPGAVGSVPFQRCATAAPDAQWDAKFNQMVEEYQADHNNPNAKVETVPATIPVIFHIIHNGTAVGSGANISAAQVASQLTVMNADYSGTNADYSSVPSAFQAVKAGDCQVQFCLATIDKNGNTMAEPGIERMTYTAAGASSDPNGWTMSTFQSNFDSQIKPNTIWDPVKYMNIWVTRAGTSQLLGYASFPAATGLAGLSGVETATTSGLVINYQGFGTMGTAQAPYNKGRTVTHECGHWLGLRHISGDATCGNDYCNDTPTQMGGYNGGTPNPSGQGGLNYSCPPYPYLASGECTGTNSATAAGSEMFMNYMDYVDDACMYMFTLDQRTRIQTSLTNGTYRKDLGTHGLCSTTPTAPVAAFSVSSTGCTNTGVTVTNNTSGNPSPTYSWTTSPSTGVTISSSTASAPTFTFANAATYTISVTATNSQGSNSSSQTISITDCALTVCDTMTNQADTNTITIYGTANGGYVSGTNGYNFTELTELYNRTGITGNVLTGVQVWFYTAGLMGTGNTTFEAYNVNTSTSAPTGTAIASNVVSIPTIISGSMSGGGISAYTHTFTTPPTLTADMFQVGLKLPTTAASGDTVAIISSLFDASNLTASGWMKYNGNWSAIATAFTSNSFSMCIFPIVCPASVGLAASELNNQVVIFPNPSTGVVNFAFTLQNQSDVNIEITNMLGQVVYKGTETNMSLGTKSVDLSGVSKGVYLVTVSTPTSKMIRKVVIN